MNLHIAMKVISLEPLGFVGGGFEGSELTWSGVDQETFAAISTFKRSNYSLWGGVDLFGDHQNLTIVFSHAMQERCSQRASLQSMTIRGRYRSPSNDLKIGAYNQDSEQHRPHFESQEILG